MQNSTTEQRKLPWSAGQRPLMLAPMQGLTNRALRSLFIEQYAPDIVFTEYFLVRAKGGNPVSQRDRKEVRCDSKGVPLVVQLIGSEISTLAEAVKIVQDLGARHININLGCPYGRMANKKAGGALLKQPSRIEEILCELRQCIDGSLSVKVRSGMEDSSELPLLIDVFERSGVDFIILHPRTVMQKYDGAADHRVTAEAVKQTSLPVIANGDICTVAESQRVFELTGVAGLMMGRGAIADPLLFKRIRGEYAAEPSPEMRRMELKEYLHALLLRYEALFCGEQQVLAKMKEVVAQIRFPELKNDVKQLQRSKQISSFLECLEQI